MRVIIEFDGGVQYVSGRIANPDRIYFDLHAARLAQPLLHKKIEADGPLVSAIRTAQSANGVVRVVLDVNGVKDYTASLLNNSGKDGPTRLVIDLYADRKAMGDRVAVTTLMTTVDEPGALEAYIYVPVNRSRSLRLGLPVKLLDPSGTLLANTSVTFVSPQVDSDTQTVLAKAAAPNSQVKLRVSQQVRAQVNWGKREGATIPFLSMNRINGQFFAFVSANEGKGTVARQKLLKIGDNVGNDVEVLEGIKPGDHLIVSGTQFLQDGMPVTEQSSPAANAQASPANSKESSN